MELPNLEDLDVTTADWEPGRKVFSGCHLLRPLAHGGFGDVWRAHWEPVGPIALKRIEVRDPVRNESRALRLLQGIRHPHLASILGFRREGEFLIVAMELGDRTVEDRLAQCRGEGRTGIEKQELRRYIRQVASALDFLFLERRLLHRDVKPSNILLFGDQAKVCDYGLAKVVEDGVGKHSGVASFDFAPPEFFEGKVVASSDQFSLAVTYVYLRVGRRPFPGPGVRQLMLQHLNGKPALEGLDPKEQEILRKALSREPGERFANCVEFAEAVSQAG